MSRDFLPFPPYTCDMTVLVTGAAGFIGFHVCRTLLERGESVVGVDNLNDYYDVDLKKARLKEISGSNRFTLHKLDFSDYELLRSELEGCSFSHIVHLGAQAGVRHSLSDPFVYAQSNLLGHLSMLEFARHHPDLKHMVYASSSSVYGGNEKQPFSESDSVDRPVSLYAATKKADELMSHSYSHLYGIPQTGLRFFTVYGPWGRPDMAMWIFTKAMLKGEPITLFNQGDMSRDFSYIDDVVDGILTAMDSPPAATEEDAPHKVYNIGGGRPENLAKLVELLEKEIGSEARKEFAPMQPGDVKETFADINEIREDLGFTASTPLEVGVPRFVEWFKAYHGC